MGNRLIPVSETLLPEEDQTWLVHGYEDAFETAEGIVLDHVSCAALFPAANSSNLVVIPAGTLLAKITATGKYGPYDATTPATDGRQLVKNATTHALQVGFLGKTTQLNPIASLSTLVDVDATLIWQGEVSLSKLTAATGLSTGIGWPATAVVDAMTQVKFVA